MNVKNLTPRPRLGEGAPSAPRLSTSLLAAIRSKVDDAISAVSNALDNLQVYAAFLAPNTLRADPYAYQTIPDIGPMFTPEELRTILADDVDVLGSIAGRIARGPASAYVTGDQLQALNYQASRANGIVSAIRSSGATSAVSDLELASEQQEEIVQDAADLMGEIERAVVAGEAGSVPVLEPYEKEDTVVQIAVGVGIAAAIIYAIWRFS